jgi:ELWxxDGT repeat protein
VFVRNPLTRAGSIALLLVCASVVGAQPHLVKDINLKESPVGSMPGGLASIGNVTFFFANDQTSGNELWKTDGTEAGTVMVKDIAPGAASGFPTDRLGGLVAGNRIVFVASDGDHGLEPWASDGTAGGTVMLADIAPGATSSNPVLNTTAGSIAYFTATAPATGMELWGTDGTPAGTRIVKDLNAGPGSSSPRILGAFGTRLAFRAFDGTATGLFTTDGTAEGTTLVSHLSGVSGVAAGKAFLFAAVTGASSWDLMRTDGTAGGTVVLRPAFSGSPPVSFTAAGDTAYFAADDGISGSEVWASDGTAGGTHLVADLAPGSAGLTISGMAVLGGRLLFMTIGLGGQLWTTDGTASGTRVVKSMPFATPGFVSGANYYFGWSGEGHGFELWKSDGTTEGTSLVKDIAPGSLDSMFVAYFVPRPDGIFFAANDSATGFEPWISDGTAAGTRLVRNIARDTALGSYPSGLDSVGGKLFFSAWDGVSSSIWISDGTSAGTSALSASSAGPQPIGEGVASGGLYYYVAGELPSLELWRTDGTAAGTFRLSKETESRFFDALIPFKGGLFFQATDDAHGAEPWFTDGTVAGTRLIADLLPGIAGSFGYASEATAVDDLVYFPAQGTGPGGTQAWRTDGTAAGTKELSAPDWRDSVSPQAFTRIGDWVYYAANLNDDAFNLWRTNIASGEMVLVRRFLDVHAPYAMWNVGGVLLFTLRGELWRSDGTEAGTARVLGAIPVPACFHRQDFAVGGGLLFWLAFNNYVPELWRSDGTAAGTFRLGAFEGPYADSLQECITHDLHYHGGRLYFVGRDEIHGAEPWVSDGTIAGTHILYDLNPGIASSDPAQFVTFGGILYFTATEPTSGQELWATCVDDCPTRRRAVGR